MKISYLKNREIDKKKWNEAIDNSSNSLFYGFSWYLDIVSPSWSALVSENYEYILPLPCSKKYFLNYIYQPFFTSRFNIFSKNEIKKHIFEDFINSIPKKFVRVDLKIGFEYFENTQSFDFEENKNYQLNLNSKYETLLSNYSKKHMANIRKAIKNEVKISEKIDIDNFIQMRKESMRDKGFTQITDNHFNMLKKIFQTVQKNGMLKMFEAKDINDKICGYSAFIEYSGRTIKYSTANHVGRKNSASYALIDRYIKEKAGKNFILDFAGSNIESIAKFIRGFGAEKQSYISIHKKVL